LSYVNFCIMIGDKEKKKSETIRLSLLSTNEDHNNYNLASYQIIISLIVSIQLTFHDIYALNHNFILIRPL